MRDLITLIAKALVVHSEQVSVKIDNPPFKSAPKAYFGEVRWCKKLEGDDNSHLYGIGIKITSTANDLM